MTPHEIGGLILKPLANIEPVYRDPDDDHVIATALMVRTGYIVTGDKDLLALGQHRNIQMVTARQFLERIDETR